LKLLFDLRDEAREASWYVATGGDARLAAVFVDRRGVGSVVDPDGVVSSVLADGDVLSGDADV
jgi:hypothetical protein